MKNEQFTPDLVETNEGTKISIKGFQQSLVDFPMRYRAAISDKGEPYLFGSCVYSTNECGCKISGNGTLQFPMKINYCPQHAAAPDMYEALKNLIDHCERLVGMPGADIKWLHEAKAALSKANPNN